MRKKSRKLEPEEIRRHLQELDALSDQSDEELEKTEGKSDEIERKNDQTERKSDQTYLDEPLNVDTVVHEGSEQDLN